MRKLSLFNSILLIVICFLLLCFVGGRAESASAAYATTYLRPPSQSQLNPASESMNRYSLQVSLATNKRTYKLSDTITFKVLLENKSKSTIYLYRLLGFGEDSGISLLIKDDTTGKIITGNFIADEMPPPPSSKTDFVKLAAGYIYGSLATFRISNLNIDKKGTYEILAQYHSPIPASMGFGLPIWSAEMGSISSNSITITIDE